MLWLEVVVAAAVLVGVAFVVTTGGGIDDVDVDTRDLGLPADRLLRSDDIARLRFRAISGFWGGLRGYRFDDVDRTMAKVEESLRAYEERYGEVVLPPAARSADPAPGVAAGSAAAAGAPAGTRTTTVTGTTAATGTTAPAGSTAATGSAAAPLSPAPPAPPASPPVP